MATDPSVRAQAIQVMTQGLINGGMPPDLAAKAAKELVDMEIAGRSQQ